MKSYERTQLLERVEREGATVGAQIPDTVDLDGERFDLRAFVFEVKRRETVPPEDRERVEELKKTLRRERRHRVQRIEDEDEELTWEAGERLVEQVIGLDRALNALQQLGETDLEGEMEAKQRADRQRWLGFLKQATGRDDARRRRR